jgi:predicted tellurium resistance membrane protein TerC
MDFSALITTDGLVSLLTLSAMEIVLGIDNIVFLTILTARLPAHRQAAARRIGLAMALISRLGLLFAISWVMGLKQPLITLLGRAFSGRDLILLAGGIFLVGKATKEIHEKLETPDEAQHKPRGHGASFGLVLVQVTVLDLVFSLDSVITAVGMVDEIVIMVVAMLIAVGIMLAFAGPIGSFVHRHPTMKMLALSFLILIGVVLIVDGTGHHIPKGYIYFAMAFSFSVEMLNLKLRKPSAPVSLHDGQERLPRQPGGHV